MSDRKEDGGVRVLHLVLKGEGGGVRGITHIGTAWRAGIDLAKRNDTLDLLELSLELFGLFQKIATVSMTSMETGKPSRSRSSLSRRYDR